MSSDISWMKKGLRKRPPADWFSDPKSTTSSNSSKTNGQVLTGQQKSGVNEGRLKPSEQVKDSEDDILNDGPAYQVRNEVTAVDAWNMHKDCKPSDFVLTTLPPIYPKGSNVLTIDPDGITECLIYAPTKALLMNTPGFPQRIRRPSVPSYEIREIPGRGNGAIALRDIEAGELIIAERPLIISPISISFPHHTSRLPNGVVSFAPVFKGKEVQNEIHRLFDLLIDRMDNSLIKNLEMMGVLLFMDEVGQMGLQLLSMEDLNLFCCPSTAYHFEKASLSMELRAVRKIPKGEEITITYIEKDFASTDKRQASLQSYGFTCTCIICINPSESDAVCTFIRSQLVPHAANVTDPLEVALEHIELLEKWQMESYQIYQPYLMRVSDIYHQRGDMKTARKFMFRSASNILAKYGREQAHIFLAREAQIFGQAECQAWSNKNII
ncbi:hypothetical protein C8Q75DRAFT_735302 [Abortiporus biennis]|nr:hypothetical protein C8Q75DRAFT_735302 [Abortiporus biennis]